MSVMQNSVTVTVSRATCNSKGSMIVVSNRLPFILKRNETTGELERKASAGGLVTAVAPVVIRGKGIWVGWPGIHLDNPNEKIPESDPNDKTPTAGLLSSKIVAIHAEPKLFDSYYNGCCNGTFWPLFHSMPDRATFIVDHWKAYVKINEEFAMKTIHALKLLKDKKEKDNGPPIVWVHDYHLMLAANWIRQRAEEDEIKCKLGFFLHIPFPPWDIFRLLPWSDEVLQGILGCDMVGFHITDYCLNFIDCCQRSLGCRVDRKNLLVELGGRTICVRPLPIGVPFDRFVSLAQNAKPVLNMSQQIILGVDRLDYTKGLVHKLKAFERLLEKHPEHIEKVVLLQISVPSRTDVKEYQDLKEEVDQLVGRINGRFTTPNWSPIRYIFGCIGQEQLASFYRDAAVALVTPLRDGMNLVAKEFVACQINKPPGVLIVSPFAGASEMMHEALICNPYELDDCAAVIHRALIMPEDERTVRMNHLRRREQQNDVDSWMMAFLKAMDSLEEEADDVGATSMQPVTIDDFDEYLSKYIGYTQKLALLLDYDGTLAPIAPHPDLATLPLETKHTLQRLSNMSDVYIAIISGRNVNNVKEMVGIEGITYAGNHGLEILHPDGSKFVHPMPLELQDKVVDLLKALQEQVCKDGAWVENKGALLTFHFRETPLAKRAALADVARQLITAAGFEAAPAHCAIEARPPVEWNKGRASIYILRTAFGLDWSERIRIIYAGDDVTDEDAMLALKGMAATFRIASSTITKTSAERRLSSTDSVLAMLKWVERHFSRRKPRANSLTYKGARIARDTLQMQMSYHLPPRSPRQTPPRTPEVISSGSDSS
ncbi:alpha,alpha-trehalose-phosphate synthase [UDP-forming] [Maniola jurtina]|uniref:alpha,alpha-trehalose-phosphate synthase [UDP-forming] n=1 Tax=Maniola jurtina TaxID=191418 RepID=UPI001E689E2F|nr:alpha,alpha-trehalose-phosphate synthase [UDP-forming] [Maniola jurtina]